MGNDGLNIKVGGYMNTETVKQYLNSCRAASRTAQEMEIDVEAFRSEKMSARHILDGMPHGSDKKRLFRLYSEIIAIDKETVESAL